MYQVLMGKDNKTEKQIKALEAKQILVVELTLDGNLNKTWKQIADAPFAVLKTLSIDDGVITALLTPVASTATNNSNSYTVTFGETAYTTDNANGYPVTPIPPKKRSENINEEGND